MNNEDRVLNLNCVLFVMCLITSVLLIFDTLDIKELKAHAIKSGAATWVVDDNGGTKFKWLDDAGFKK